jgi:hypothetical protein
MPVTKANLSVRIIGVPPGEAPLGVREKWVGLELPLTRYPAPRDYFTFGVLSQPAECLAQLWAVARGRARRVAGFAVEGARAIEVLERSSPEAAAWWREHAPQYLAPKHYLVFHENVCEAVGASKAPTLVST